MTTDSYSRPILLVEDNPMDVDLTLRAFARRKFANPVQVARDGDEALRVVSGWTPPSPLPLIVLLDLKLPKVDGLDVLSAIKRHESFRFVPVIVLTSSTEDRDVQRAYALGANSYIVKPVDFEKFLEVTGQLEVYWCALNTPPR